MTPEAEMERLQENKTCRHCGWSGAPYHVVCPSCFTLAIEAARQAKELETRLAEVEREAERLRNALDNAHSAHSLTVEETGRVIDALRTRLAEVERERDAWKALYDEKQRLYDNKHALLEDTLAALEHHERCENCNCADGFDQARGGGQG